MTDVDIAPARELVKDLRDKLLYDEEGNVTLYDGWKPIQAKIYDRLGEDISLEHLVALGACSEIDAQHEMASALALIAFCKSIALESTKLMEEDAA